MTPVLVSRGRSPYSVPNATIAVMQFNIVTHLPVKGQRYFVGGLDGVVIRRFDGTVHEVSNALLFFKDVKPR